MFFCGCGVDTGDIPREKFFSECYLFKRGPGKKYCVVMRARRCRSATAQSELRDYLRERAIIRVFGGGDDNCAVGIAGLLAGNTVLSGYTYTRVILRFCDVLREMLRRYTYALYDGKKLFAEKDPQCPGCAVIRQKYTYTPSP